MASEAPVADHAPNKHIEEKEVTVAKNVEGKAAPQAAKVKEECHHNGESTPVLQEKKEETMKASGQEETAPTGECDHKGESAPVVEERQDKTTKDSGQGTDPVVEVKTDEVMKDSGQEKTLVVEEKRDDVVKDSGEEIPSVKQDEVMKDSGQEAPAISRVVEEKPDVSNPVQLPSEAAKKPSEAGTLEATKPLNLEDENVIKGSDSVESAMEDGKSLENHSELAIEKQESESIPPAAEPKIEVDKPTCEQPIVTTESATKVVETVIDKNTESPSVSGLVKEVAKSPEEIESMTVEVEKSPAGKPIDIPMVKEPKLVEVKTVKVEKLPSNQLIKTPVEEEKMPKNQPVQTPAEEVPEVPKSAVEAATAKENLNGIAKETETIPPKEETRTTAAVEPKSNVKGDENVPNMYSVEDKGSETHVHPEDISCTTEGENVPEVTEKSDSRATAIESVSKETDDGIAMIEGLANDGDRVDGVVPVVTGSSDDKGQKPEKENPPSDLNEAMTPVDVVALKEVVVDTSATAPSVNVAAETAAVTEVADILEVLEALGKQPEVNTIKSVVKEAVRGSEDASEVVETPAGEAVKTAEAPEEQIVLTRTANLVAGDEQTPKDITDTAETVVREVSEGTVVADIAEKLYEEKKEETKEACKGNGAADASKTDDSKKEDEEKDGTEEIDTGSLAEAPKDTTEATKQEVPTKTRTPNMISKVKHSLVKAKKAIFGKSPSSKTISSETKGETKA